MRVAIVHDWLHEKVGGAEHVLFELVKHFPQADVYALTYNEKLFRPYMGMRHVRTSFLNKSPRLLKKNPQYLLPFMKKAVTSFDLSDYELVITNSTAWSKNIRLPQEVKHLSYCHSPARMLWDSWPRYVSGNSQGKGRLDPISRFVVTRIVSKLRLWDYYSTSEIDLIAANSMYIAKRISKFYGVKAEVLYPPVDAELTPHNAAPEPYWLVLSVLSKYKNIELAIEAFKTSGRKLIIAGDGPDRKRLLQVAQGATNIVFEGRVTQERKIELYAGAEAFVFMSIEDFGMTPIEAMACGTPIVALRGGGISETVKSGVGGVFFTEPTPQALNAAIEKARNKNWNHSSIQQLSAKYSKEHFHNNLDELVSKVLRP